MRTGHSLTICQSLLPVRGCLLWGVSALGGVCSGVYSWEVCSRGVVCSWGGVCSMGCLLPGGVCSWGVSTPWGGVYSQGVSALGGVCSRGCGIPPCTVADTPLWTEWQTGVKILSWPQFIAAGNKIWICDIWQGPNSYLCWTVILLCTCKYSSYDQNDLMSNRIVPSQLSCKVSTAYRREVKTKGPPCASLYLEFCVSLTS